MRGKVKQSFDLLCRIGSPIWIASMTLPFSPGVFNFFEGVVYFFIGYVLDADPWLTTLLFSVIGRYSCCLSCWLSYRFVLNSSTLLSSLSLLLNTRPLLFLSLLIFCFFFVILHFVLRLQFISRVSLIFWVLHCRISFLMAFDLCLFDVLNSCCLVTGGWSCQVKMPKIVWNINVFFYLLVI